MTAKELKFESAAAERQYNQLLRREWATHAAMRNVVAVQWLAMTGGGLSNFMEASTVAIAIATSGSIQKREISRFTVLRATARNWKTVIDWDMCRISRNDAPPHVPKSDHFLFSYALSMDKARETAALTGQTLPQLKSEFKLPPRYKNYVSPAVFPVFSCFDGVYAPAIAPAVLEETGADAWQGLTGHDAATRLRKFLIEKAVETVDGWLVPSQYVMQQEHVPDWFDMRQFKGAVVRNPIQDYVTQPFPWQETDFKLTNSVFDNDAAEQLDMQLNSLLPAVRTRMGAASCLFSDDDLITQAINSNGIPRFGLSVQASGKKKVSLQEGMPLLQAVFGPQLKMFDSDTLETALNFPSAPLMAPAAGKISVFWKGTASNTDALQAAGLLDYPDLPKVMLPRG